MHKFSHTHTENYKRCFLLSGIIMHCICTNSSNVIYCQRIMDLKIKDRTASSTSKLRSFQHVFAPGPCKFCQAYGTKCHISYPMQETSNQIKTSFLCLYSLILSQDLTFCFFHVTETAPMGHNPSCSRTKFSMIYYLFRVFFNMY